MALRERIQSATDWLKRVVTQPRSELTRWQAAVRFAYDLGRYGARQLNEDRASEMAAALAFRTLFALFPILVVAGAFFQGLYGREPFRDFVRNLIEGLGLADVAMGEETRAVDPDAAAAPEVPVDPDAAAAPEVPVDADAAAVPEVPVDADVPPPDPETAERLGVWLEQFIFQITDIDLATLGWIGFVIVVYASIAMMVTIEDAFNTVYRAAEGRSWTRRIPIYWTVLTMGAVGIWAVFQIDARFGEWVGEVGLLDWLRQIARTLWTFTIIWMALLGVYVLVPNTLVAWRSALVGSFVAGLGVFIGKELLAGYVATFVTVRQLAGAIGFVPLLMFWVYVMWLVILFGLEVAATLQNLGGRRSMEEMEAKRPRQGLIDPASILLVMEQIAQRFNEGQPAAARQISEATSIPTNLVSEMIERLSAAGLVHRLDRDEACATLARPPEQISAEALIEVGYAMVDELAPGRKSQLIQRLRAAERDLAANATLASLLKSSASGKPDDATADER